MKVLIACEESQRVCIAFRGRGHEAYSCDIQDCVSSKIFDMPEHTQEIQPYQFGHPYTKKTRLWLRNLPPLTPTNVTEPVAPYVPSGTGRKDKSKYGAARRGADAKERSKTFPGIAEAMAEQWGGGARTNG